MSLHPQCRAFHTLLNCSTATAMSDENVPANDPWWKVAIKWTVIIYGIGAAITFLISLVVFGSALTSISQALGLAIVYAAFWPLFIILLFR